jgi:ABC-type branched-subunit amino acid transport system permease subunit
MSEFLTALVSGLVAASFYTTYGLGLAVVYRTTGVLNFAYGAVGSVSGYVAYSLLQHRVPYGFAVVLAILTGIVLSLLIQVVLLSQLPTRSAEAAGIATLGVTLLIEGLLLLIYGGNALSLPPLLKSRTLFVIGSYQVQTLTLIDIAVAVVASLGLGAFLYRSRAGLRIRAMSEGSQTASMFGINPGSARAMVWATAGALASVTAILVTPTYYLTPGFMTTYLVAAFVVVVVGGFERLLGVVVGALIFGVLESLFSTYVTGKLTNTISFGIILIVLIFLPYGILGRPLSRVPEASIPRPAGSLFRRFGLRRRSGTQGDHSALDWKNRIGALTSRRIAFTGPVILTVIALVIGTTFSQSNLLLGSNIAATFVAVLGADLIFGYTGQLSIGQSGFMMIGAYVAVLLETKSGVPFLLALVIATVSGAVGGAVLGLPAARLRGIYLAVLTLAFALAVPETVAYFASVTSGDNGLGAPVPGWLGAGTDATKHLYFLVVIVAGLAAAVVMAVGRSRWGREWRAVRDSDVAAAANGVSVVRTRSIAFAFGSALCALSGALLATVTAYLSPESFTLWTSIYLIVAVVVGGRVSTFGALLGSIFIVAVPYESTSIPALSNLLLGALLVVVLLLRPDGLEGFVVDCGRWLSRLPALFRGSKPAVPPTAGAPNLLVGKDRDVVRD